MEEMTFLFLRDNICITQMKSLNHYCMKDLDVGI